MSLHSKEKVYTKRPLCVVYYGVDFSFDGRQGGLNFDSCSFACTVSENQVWKAAIESFRFWEEDDYGYDIFSALIIVLLRSRTNVSLAGKRDSCHHSITSFSERRDLTKLRRWRQRQKAMGLVSKTTALHVRHDFLVHFFAVPARLRREMTKNLSFFEDGNGKSLKILLSLSELRCGPLSSAPT